MASPSRYSTMTANSLGYNSLATVPPSQPSTVGNHKQLFRRSSIASSVTSGASSAYSRNNNNITLQSSVSSGGHGGGPTLQGPQFVQGQSQNGLTGGRGDTRLQQTSYLDNDAKSTFVRLKQVRQLRTISINPYFFPRIGMNKEVDDTELSHVGVGHTDS